MVNSTDLSSESKLTLLERLIAEKRARNQRKDESLRIAENAAAARERCEKFSGFVKEAWHVLEPTTPYVHNWHVDAIGEHLQAIHAGQIQRFQLNMPPGMMKSTTVSVMFGAWEWTDQPGLRYFTTSYEAGYARRDSRKHRDLVLSEWYQMLWPLALTRVDEADFENISRGGRKAVPFSRLTSGRGNRLIIDDPHSTEQAESEAERETTTRMFRESATSRLNDPERDTIIVVMHRLHPDDICGVIDQLGLPYVKLILPMEHMRSLSVKTPWFEDPRKTDGELLFPKRLGPEKLAETKTELGPHAYDTQYQQLARARAGSYFFGQEQLLEERVDNSGVKTYVPFETPRQCDAVFAIVDTASKKGKQRDGTGSTYFAYTKRPTPCLRILDWDIAQIEGHLLTAWLPNVFTRLEELARQCGARAGSTGVWIEDKDSGVVLLQHAAANNWPARAIESSFTAVGKDGRALSVSGYINKRLVGITAPAFEKTSIYKGRSRNHLLYQVTTYRMGVGTPTDEDELFDTFCYGAGLALGGAKGF